MREQIENETVDLCYIDPPFNSDKDYNFTKNTSKSFAFKDKWKWNKHAENSFEEIVANEGSIYTNQTIKLIEGFRSVLDKSKMLAYYYIHDTKNPGDLASFKRYRKFLSSLHPTMSHYLKLLLDSIFVARGGEFRNEIIWCYRRAAYPKKDFGRKHDNIFRYSKSKNITFNLDLIRISYSKETLERFKYKINNKRSNNDYGEVKLNPLGKHPEDWWELQPIMPSAKECLGYPTQKPEALLERIIKASSNEKDIILDAFCGCGTTIAIAQKLKRRWIGIDISPLAIELTKQRVNALIKKGVFICKN